MTKCLHFWLKKLHLVIINVKQENCCPGGPPDMEEGGGDLIPFYPLISEKNTFDRLEISPLDIGRGGIYKEKSVKETTSMRLKPVKRCNVVRTANSPL